MAIFQEPPSRDWRKEPLNFFDYLEYWAMVLVSFLTVVAIPAAVIYIVFFAS